MKLVFFGDSITDAGRKHDCYPLGSEYGEGYIFLIKEKLKKPAKYQIVNKGTNGDTISLLLSRYKNDVIDLNPDIITILIGINDIWRRIDNISYGCKVDEFKIKFDSLIKKISKELPNSKIIVLEPFCLKGEATEEHFKLFSEIYDYAKEIKKICSSMNITFIPLQNVISEKAKEIGDNSQILFDGVHPTKLGAQLICDQWIKYTKENL